MGTSGKIALAALAALVLLFVLGVVAGPGGAGDRPEDADGGVLGSLRGAFAGSAEVAADELGGDCVRPDGSVAVQGACVLVVARGEQRLRLLRLRTDRGVTVTAPGPAGSDVTMTKAFSRGEVIEVAVDQAGARVVLACLACVLVRTEEEP